MTLQETMISAIHRAILARPARVPAPLLASAKRLEKADAEYQKAGAEWQKAYAEWQKVNAEWQKAYAEFKEMLARYADKIEEFLQ